MSESIHWLEARYKAHWFSLERMQRMIYLEISLLNDSKVLRLLDSGVKLSLKLLPPSSYSSSMVIYDQNLFFNSQIILRLPSSLHSYCCHLKFSFFYSPGIFHLY